MPSGSANNPPNIQNGMVGNLKVNNFDSGQKAGPGTFWRGDGHWASGYGVGSGGSVIQGTSITTAVTLNTITGTILTFNNAFTAGTFVSFQVNNTFCNNTCVVIANVQSTSSGAALVVVTHVDNGFFTLSIDPFNTATFTILINFVIFQGSAT